MTYKILANKWRPKDFSEIVGQSTVVTILRNSLSSSKLHHAYLFTGTRGVGKTTLARIFAKALICAKGISADPCNSCNFCLAVDAGNALDVLEIDAASRTKLEDTKVVLDNLVYAPSFARFKIYIIDEVHMLSNHSFNALLKTLEDPPEHVKFLLATTDPQKLPITVLSRCLQFKLKGMRLDEINKQLAKILIQENIAFEHGCLLNIAEMANGSMRDAISLLEQVLAFSGNAEIITDQKVLCALQLPDKFRILELLAAIVIADANLSLKILEDFFRDNIDPHIFLARFQVLLKDLILLQLTAPTDVENRGAYQAGLQQLIEKTTLEELQLYSEIIQHCSKNLAFNPDLKVGIEMMILRMIAFSPVKSPNYHSIRASIQSNHSENLVQSAHSNVSKDLLNSNLGKTKHQSNVADSNYLAEIDLGKSSNVFKDLVDLNLADTKHQSNIKDSKDLAGINLSKSSNVSKDLLNSNLGDTKHQSNVAENQSNVVDSKDLAGIDFPKIVTKLELSGFAKQLAMSSVFEYLNDKVIKMIIDQTNKLIINNNIGLIEQAYSNYLNTDIKIVKELKSFEKDPELRMKTANYYQQIQRQEFIDSDPNLSSLIQNFDGNIEQR